MLPNFGKRVECKSNYDCANRRQNCADINSKGLSMTSVAENKFKQDYVNNIGRLLSNEMKWKIMDNVVDAFKTHLGTTYSCVDPRYCDKKIDFKGLLEKNFGLLGFRITCKEDAVYYGES